MPFRDLSRRAELVLRALLVTAYLAAAYAGAAALLWPPSTIEPALGMVLARVWAGLALLGGVVCAVAVLTARYRVEWVAVWYVVTGVTIYAATVWHLAATATTSRQTQAAALTALAWLLLYRGTELTARAARLRRRHVVTMRVSRKV